MSSDESSHSSERLIDPLLSLRKDDEFPNGIHVVFSHSDEAYKRSLAITNLKFINSHLDSLITVRNTIGNGNPIPLEKMMKMKENQVLALQIEKTKISSPNDIHKIYITSQIVNCYVSIFFPIFLGWIDWARHRCTPLFFLCLPSGLDTNPPKTSPFSW